MNSDNNLQQRIQDKLQFAPGVHAQNIVFNVNDGIVTVNGSVGSYAEKNLLKSIICKISGVKAIADEVVVKPVAAHIPNDTEIARAIANMLEWDSTLPKDKIKISVEQGKVTLSGEVTWHYQRQHAERDVRYVPGVVAIDNQVQVNPQVAIASPTLVKAKIKQEFERHALIDAQSISVELDGSTITLKGKVQSWAEVKEATEVAWSIPGVTKVENQIDIVYDVTNP